MTRCTWYTQIFMEQLLDEAVAAVKAPETIAPYAKKTGSPSIAGPRGWELAERSKIFDVKA